MRDHNHNHTFRSIGGFRCPPDQRALPILGEFGVFTKFFDKCVQAWTDTQLVGAILFISAGDCKGEALIVRDLLRVKTPGHILMFDPNQPEGALQTMQEQAPGIQSAYFTNPTALFNHCNEQKIQPALVISLNHSLGLICSLPEVLDPLDDLLRVCRHFVDNNMHARIRGRRQGAVGHELEMVLCYYNDKEDYKILRMPMNDWITEKQKLMTFMRQMMERELAAKRERDSALDVERAEQIQSDRKLARDLEAMQLQERADFHLAQRLADTNAD